MSGFTVIRTGASRGDWLRGVHNIVHQILVAQPGGAVVELVADLGIPVEPQDVLDALAAGVTGLEEHAAAVTVAVAKDGVGAVAPHEWFAHRLGGIHVIALHLSPAAVVFLHLVNCKENRAHYNDAYAGDVF